MTEPQPQTLGRYVIQAELGKGGFATVFRALDTSLNREVALKILHPQLLADRTLVDRFRKEARTLASLRHAHIVTIYEVSEAEGCVFLAMELAHGSSLAQAIAERQRLPWPETLAILKPVTEALDYAHGQGVIHRDLKPANILLDAERGPLLTDFGFARLMGDSSVSMSLSGGILGTPAYIAPEVWELDTATAAVDIYALGCIAYEMVTGEVLFSGKTPMQTMRAHDRGPQFSTTWPGGVPQDIERALQVALARQPETRYPSASALWHALNDLEANAQATREQAERQAIADQWKAEVEAALADHEWSAAKMAVGRWLAITPEDARALAARDEIARQIEQDARGRVQEEAAEQDTRGKMQEAEAAAEEKRQQDAAAQILAENARQDAERKAKENAERQAREQQKREAAQVAVEKARLAEAERAHQAEPPNMVQQIVQQEAITESKTSPWLVIVGMIVVVAIIVALAIGGGNRPTQAPVETAPVVESPTQAPVVSTAIIAPTITLLPTPLAVVVRSNLLCDVVYAAGWQGGGVYLIDINRGEIISQTKTSIFNNRYLDWNDLRQELYVVSDNDGVISIVKPNPLREIGTISDKVGWNGYSMAVSPKGDAIFVTYATHGVDALNVRRVVVFDPVTQKAIRSVQLDNTTSTAFLAISPDGEQLYVSWDSNLDVYKTSDMSLTHREKNLTTESGSLATSRDGHYLYIVQPYQVLKWDLNSNTIVATTQLEKTQHGDAPITLSSDGSSLWIGGANQIYSLSGSLQDVSPIPSNGTLPDVVISIAESRDTSSLYISDLQTLSVIDLATNKVAKSMSISISQIGGMVVRPCGGE